MITSKNIFYISNFNVIGGTENFIYELARKYNDYDITVVYKTGSYEQLIRLRKYVRVVKFNNQEIECERAFFNYDTDIIDNIKAKEYIQIIHALFKTQGINPTVNPKIDRYLCVSKKAGEEWEELTGIKPKLCRNPLTITEEEKQKVLYLVSATRLTAEKGKERMIELANQLDRANIKYLWLVFTNDPEEIDNPNIVYMKPRLDIRPFIASIKGKGYGVQLSDSEGDCYFTRECEGLGVPLIVTPIASFKEQGLKDGINCYFVPFDMKNIDIDKIFNKIPSYEGFFNEDKWDKELVKSKSTYKKELQEKIKVKCIQIYDDLELNKRITPEDKPYEITKARYDVLKELNVIEIVT